MGQLPRWMGGGRPGEGSATSFVCWQPCKPYSQEIAYSSSKIPLTKSKFVLSILLCGLSCTVVTASGPVPPEIASFSPLDQDELVDDFTGDFRYSVPLMDVPGPNGGYPLTLNYASGITLDQDASWVGLGWTLSPGAIVRQMRGIPDEFEGCAGNSCANQDCNAPSGPANPAPSGPCDTVTATQDIEPSVTFGLGISGDYEFFGADTSVGTGVSIGLKAYFDNY